MITLIGMQSPSNSQKVMWSMVFSQVELGGANETFFAYKISLDDAWGGEKKERKKFQPSVLPVRSAPFLLNASILQQCGSLGRKRLPEVSGANATPILYHMKMSFYKIGFCVWLKFSKLSMTFILHDSFLWAFLFAHFQKSTNFGQRVESLYFTVIRIITELDQGHCEKVQMSKPF